MGKAAEFQAPDLIETGILDRAADDWGWKGQAVKNQAIKWYVAFLQVVYNNPGGRNFIVTREADELWHTHVTFTTKYRQYCEAILGFYLDHTPPAPGYSAKATAKDVRAAKRAYKPVTDDWPDIRAAILVNCW
jgi:hypothetical protein